MSLIGTCHHSGPSTTVRMINDRTTALATASRWRRKRRHASRPGAMRLRGAATATALAVGNAWVEPAIEEIRQQVEKDDEAREHEGDRHDHRRVVGEDRGDEQRADAGHAENLL